MSIAATGTILTPWSAFAYISNNTERTLSLYNTHTGEHLHQVVYWEKGSYQRETLQKINYLLRDHRTDEVKNIDPNLLNILHNLQNKIPVNAPFEIISGYRSPATNRNLQTHSRGVAKHSLHMAGQAIDIRLPGCPLSKLRKTAASIKSGGVGYYPKSNFVHVDTGRIRYW